MASRPGTYLNWVTTAGTTNPPGYAVQPTSGQMTTGFVGSQHPPFQYLNWLFYILDQWIQYFDSVVATSPTATTVTASGNTNIAATTSNYEALYFFNPSAAQTATLPAATTAGMRIGIKHINIGSANNVTIAVQSGNKLEGTLNGTFTMTTGMAVKLASDASGNWWFVNP